MSDSHKTLQQKFDAALKERKHKESAARKKHAHLKPDDNHDSLAKLMSEHDEKRNPQRKEQPPSTPANRQTSASDDALKAFIRQHGKQTLSRNKQHFSFSPRAILASDTTNTSTKKTSPKIGR